MRKSSFGGGDPAAILVSLVGVLRESHRHEVSVPLVVDQTGKMLVDVHLLPRRNYATKPKLSNSCRAWMVQAVEMA